MGVKSGLAAIAPPDAQLFVLGSLPGDASLAAQRYYAHPTNQFWRLLGSAIEADLQTLEYGARLKTLAARRIGLWDVIGSASRRGSLDQAIRDAQHNQIDHLLRDFSDLRAIAFNGSTASSIGRKLFGDPPAGLTFIDLPSSSAANTRPFDEKSASWGRLRKFVQP